MRTIWTRTVRILSGAIYLAAFFASGLTSPLVEPDADTAIAFRPPVDHAVDAGAVSWAFNLPGTDRNSHRFHRRLPSLVLSDFIQPSDCGQVFTGLIEIHLSGETRSISQPAISAPWWTSTVELTCHYRLQRRSRIRSGLRDLTES